MYQNAHEETMPIGDAPALEPDDFAALYEAHLHAVYNYCLFRVGDVAVAEDLAADSFERAWRARDRYRPDRAEFTTWLFTIVRRAVIDWQRRHARYPQVALNDQHPDSAPSPDARAETAERYARLRRLLLALELQEQELIALKFGAAMTNRQIARLVGKSESAVGSALHRIMRKLRAEWSDKVSGGAR